MAEFRLFERGIHMSSREKSSWVKAVPLAVTAVLVIVCLLFLRDVSFETILTVTPDNLFLAAMVLLLLYAVKSLSIVFPLTVFFVAAGVIFPLWAAVLMGFAGLMVSFTIPWLIGRWSGAKTLEALSEKYPKISGLRSIGYENKLFISFILRAVAIVPGDVASMLLGTAKIPYVPYIIGSQLGLLPGMLLQTMIGNALNHQFTWQMGAIFVVLMLLCFGITFFCNKRFKKKSGE